ncbi:MAG: hypothetical protein CVT95_06085 [Bacteroidetes bacterium HGW-Bacteroidetes-12]|nr:MAG: hypothetical protein CVT95_06085 [Bacteroidetes bacterium HGW-Bacteroidetes-12]
MAGLLILSLSAVEARSTDVKKGKSYSNYIEKVMRYPDFAQDEKIEGTVNVLVELNENNELQIAQIWGSDTRLVKYVESRLKRFAKKHGSFNDLDDESKLISIKFNLIS